ncbi:hypothetical protein B0H15DRAFT_999443 [Mycena belliarum]|uniref:Uncharacterized protein n=1 Tax=Mycena belliarum TaxID=1033014 RepID=A0AAD6UF22_9AGAR|nr:hypothetical protein B0H15DRAFT_999443 [Mycena belliae]
MEDLAAGHSARVHVEPAPSRSTPHPTAASFTAGTPPILRRRTHAHRTDCSYFPPADRCYDRCLQRTPNSPEARRFSDSPLPPDLGPTSNLISTRMTFILKASGSGWTSDTISIVPDSTVYVLGLQTSYMDLKIKPAAQFKRSIDFNYQVSTLVMGFVIGPDLNFNDLRIPSLVLDFKCNSGKLQLLLASNPKSGARVWIEVGPNSGLTSGAPRFQNFDLSVDEHLLQSPCLPCCASELLARAWWFERQKAVTMAADSRQLRSIVLGRWLNRFNQASLGFDFENQPRCLIGYSGLASNDIFFRLLSTSLRLLLWPYTTLDSDALGQGQDFALEHGGETTPRAVFPETASSSQIGRSRPRRSIKQSVHNIVVDNVRSPPFHPLSNSIPSSTNFKFPSPRQSDFESSIGRGALCTPQRSGPGETESFAQLTITRPPARKNNVPSRFAPARRGANHTNSAIANLQHGPGPGFPYKPAGPQACSRHRGTRTAQRNQSGQRRRSGRKRRSYTADCERSMRRERSVRPNIERRARTTSRAFADGAACAASGTSRARGASPAVRAETGGIGQDAGRKTPPQRTSCIRDGERFARLLRAAWTERLGGHRTRIALKAPLVLVRPRPPPTRSTQLSKLPKAGCRSAASLFRSERY